MQMETHETASGQGDPGKHLMLGEGFADRLAQASFSEDFFLSILSSEGLVLSDGTASRAGKSGRTVSSSEGFGFRTSQLFSWGRKKGGQEGRS